MSSSIKTPVMACLFVLALLFNGPLLAQTQSSVDGSAAVPDLDICGSGKEFSVTLKPGGADVCLGTFEIDIPIGMNYVKNSAKITGATPGFDLAEVVDVSGRKVTLKIPLVLRTESPVITFQLSASCSALDLGLDKRLVGYTWTPGCSTTQTRKATSNTINLRFAKLNISMPQINQAGIGVPVSRKITIDNSGNAPISNISVRPTYGASLERVSHTGTNWTYDAATNLYTFSGTLNEGTSVSFDEEVRITGCGSGESSYDAFYGCDEVCEYGSTEQPATNNVVIDRTKVPIIRLTAVKPIVECVGQTYPHIYTITNSGSAMATDLVLNLLAGDKPANITVTDAAGGTVDAATSTITFANLAAGESLTIKFDQFYPAATDAADCSQRPDAFDIANTHYKLAYVNAGACDDNGNSPTVNLSGETNQGYKFAYSGKNVGELDITHGESYLGEIRFDAFGIPKGSYDADNASFSFDIKVSPNLTITDLSEVHFMYSGRKVTLPASAVTAVTGGYRVVLKPGDVDFWKKGEATTVIAKQLSLQFPLALDCDAGKEASYSVTGNFDRGYACTPSTAIAFSCENVNLETHCPDGDCEEGGLMRGVSSLKRVNYGYKVDGAKLPILQNGEYVKWTATDNLSSIRERSFIAFDTLEISQKGKVIGADFKQAGFKVTYPDDLDIVEIENSGKLIIKRAGQADLVIDGLSISSGGENVFLVNFPNLDLNEDDELFASLRLMPRKQDAASELRSFPTDFWLVKNQVSYGCGDTYKATGVYGSTILSVGAADDKFNMETCESGTSGAGVEIKFDLNTLSESDALFLNELRQQVVPKKVVLTIPAGLTMSAYVLEIHGNNGTILKNSYPTATAITNSTYTIDELDKKLATLRAGRVYDGPFLDEGYKVIVRPVVAMDCATSFGNQPQSPSLKMNAEVTVVGTFFNDNKGYRNETKVFNQEFTVTTDRNKLLISAPVRSVNAYSKEVKWIIEVRNTSGFRKFDNVWLSKTNVTDLTVIRAQEIVSLTDTVKVGNVITASNGELVSFGAVNPNATRYFMLTATYQDCASTRLDVAFGSSCGAAPTTYAAGKDCSVAFTQPLTFIPQDAEFQIVFKKQGEVGKRPALCEEIEYILEVNNAGGEAHDLSISVPIKSLEGLEYVANSAKYSIVYATEPGAPAFSLVPTFTNVDGTLKFDIPAANIPKLKRGERFYLTFKLVAKDCTFKSGQSFQVAANGTNFCENPVAENRRKPAGSSRIIIDGALEAEPTVELSSRVSLNITNPSTPQNLTAQFSSVIKNTGQASGANPVPAGTNITSDQNYFITLPTGWIFRDGPTALFKANEATFVSETNNRYVFKFVDNVTPNNSLELNDVTLVYSNPSEVLGCDHDFGPITHGIFTLYKPVSICANPVTDPSCMSELITASAPLDFKLTKPEKPVLNKEAIFCVTDNAELKDVDITKNPNYFFYWYETATSTTHLPENTKLVNGKKYYAEYSLINGGNCPSERLEVTVRVDEVPIVDAGLNQLSYDSGTFTLAGTAPATSNHESGKWTVVSTTVPGVVFEDDTKYNTKVTINDKAKVVLRWTLTNACAAFDDVNLEFQRLVDLGITKTVENQKSLYIVGDAVSYKLEVTNHGPGKLFSGDIVKVQEQLPAGLKDVKYLFEGDTYTDRNFTDFRLKRDLLVGEKITITVQAKVDKALVGEPRSQTRIPLANSVRVSPPAGVRDENPANDNSAANIEATRQVDLAVLKTANKTEVFAGENIEYAISIKNNGPATFGQGEVLRLKELLPVADGLTNITFSATNNHVFNFLGEQLSLGKSFEQGETIVVTVRGTVPANSKVTQIVNSVFVDAPAGVEETNTNNNQSSVTTTVKRKADLGVTKVANKAEVVSSETLSYTITVTNNGVSTLLSGETLTLNEQVPAGLTNVSYTPSIGTYSPTNKEFTLGRDLPSGANFTLVVSGTVPANYTGANLINRVTIAPPTGVIDENPTNNEATVTTPVKRKVDLNVVKTANKTAVIAGETLTYTITVTNNGPSTILNTEVLTFNEQLPAGFTVTSATSAKGTYDAALKTFTLGSDFVQGQNFTLVIAGTVDANRAVGNLVNTASVYPPSTIEETKPGDNESTITTPVTRDADLAVTKVANKTTLNVGDALTYTITVTNNGSSTLFKDELVGLDEQLPAGFVQDGAVATGGTYNAGNKTFQLASDLAKGQSFSLVISGKIANDFKGSSVTNTVKVSTPTGVTDKDPNNNTATVTTPVKRVIDLAVTKVADKTTVVAGEAITYTITIANNGAATITKDEILAVTEQLPGEAALRSIFNSVTGGHTFNLANNALTLNSDFAFGNKIIITVTGVVPANFNGSSVTNLVNIKAPEGIDEPNKTNNDAKVITPVARVADLGVTKVANKTRVVAGEALSYTIKVTNNGPTTLLQGETIGLVETLPVGLTGVTYSSIGGMYAANTSEFLLSRNLAKDESVTLTVSGTVAANYNAATINNTVKVSTPTGVDDSNPNNNEATVSTPVDRKADIAVVKTANKTTVVAGEPLSYTITVTNNGVSSLLANESIGLDEQLPVDLKNVSYVAVGGTYDATEKTFKLQNEFAKGQQVTLTVSGTVAADRLAGTIVNKVTVTAPTGVTDENPTNNESEVTTPVTRDADLAVTKVADKTNLTVGDALKYTITVTNNGSSTLLANEVVGLDEQLPAGLTNIAYQATGGTYNAGAKTFQLASNLAKGQSFTLDVTGTVAVNYTATSITNTVKVSTPAGVTDKDPNNNTGTVTTPVKRVVDLAIAKVANKTIVAAGEEIEYTISITNNGVATLVTGEIVPVTEQLPNTAGLTNVVATASNNHHYSLVGGQLTLRNDFAQGDVITITVKGLVPPKSREIELVNKVNVKAPTGVTETNPTNNDAEVKTPVIRQADLEVVKVADKAVVVAGEPLKYTITITNKGTTTLSAREVIGVDEQLPAGLTNVKYTNTGGTYNAANKTFRLRDDMATGQSVEVTVSGIVAANYTAKTITNTVSVSTPVGVSDNNLNNNTSTVVTDVERKADLAITKVANKDTVVAGEALVYTIVVKNNGVSSLVADELIGLTEQLPAGLVDVTYTTKGGTYDATANTFKLAAEMPKGTSVELKVSGTVAANYIAKTIVNNVNVATPAGVDDDNPSDNDAIVTTPVIRKADLAVTKVADKETVVAGEELVYTIKVTNNGVSSLVANEVIGLDEQLPVGLTNVSYTTSAGVYDATAKTYTLAAEFAKGDSFTLEVKGLIDATYTSKTIVNKVKVSTPVDVRDENPKNNEATVTTKVVRHVDLGVVKVADNQVTKVTAGTALSYTIKVTNNGVSTLLANEIVGLDEQVPAGLINVSYVPTGGTYDAAKKQFTLGANFAAGDSFTLQVVGTVAANYTAKTIVNKVVVSTPKDVIDENPTNNESTVTTEVNRKADLAVIKTSDKAVVVAGREITYRIAVTNNGISSLVKGERIGLVEKLPAALENVRFTSTEGTYDFAKSTFTLNKDFVKGETITLVVNAKVKSSTEEGHVLNNTVTVSTPEGVEDEDLTNNDADAIAKVTRISDVKVEKTTTRMAPYIGMETNFTITVTNNGPSDASEVVVLEKLRSGYKYVSSTTSKGTYDEKTGLWNVGELPFGSKETLSITVMVLTTGDYANNAKVGLKELDEVPENNEVTITPKPIPSPPVANDDKQTTKSNTPVDILILDNDRPGLTNSPLVPSSVEILTQPKHGTITIDANGKVVYTPNHGYVGEDDFTYRVKDELGFWSNVATVTITVVANDLFIPNVFTPNGDGNNDNFVIIGIEGFDRVGITIVNRWGNEVYRNENYDNTWNGRGLNEGTYYYIITTHKGGKSEVIKGWVLIKKR
ncbi:T9SS type B sorting domain-containing protein [Sphingobacterium sp. MYb382]|uniref:T9SS type B sorting domain-containing protein n=1 Tax=Sphingobacterium sp. MYb382 TaxID=2745278 RepID=UPI0030B2D987